MKKLILAAIAMTALHSQAEIDIAGAFADVTTENSACFTREYSNEHLRAKPRQTVREIKIKLRKVKLGEGDDSVTSTLAIQVKRKNENKTWTNNIACFDDEQNKTVRCAVECDGGSVEIVSRDQNTGKLVLKNNGVLLYGGCGEEGPNGQEVKSIFLRSRRGGDDVFNLTESEAWACADVSDEAH